MKMAGNMKMLDSLPKWLSLAHAKHFKFVSRPLHTDSCQQLFTLAKPVAHNYGQCHPLQLQKYDVAFV